MEEMFETLAYCAGEDHVGAVCSMAHEFEASVDHLKLEMRRKTVKAGDA